MHRGRGAPRSRNGCSTCRERKVKCDEVRPECQRCLRAGRQCAYPRGLKPSLQSRAISASSPAQSGASANVPAPLSPPGGIAYPSPSTRSRDEDGGVGGSNAPVEEQDEVTRILRYYQDQYLTFLTTKAPQWSFIAGVLDLGRTNSALMNLLMANVQYQVSSREKRAADRFQALEHYQTGLQDFVSLVSSDQYDPLTMLGTLFLLVQFEIHHGEHAEAVRNHLDGFNSAVLTYGDQLVPGLQNYFSVPDTPQTVSTPDSAGEVKTRYTNVLNRLGLWMAYMDALASTWDLGGSVMSTFLDRFPGSLNSIFCGSREVGKEIWGAKYPVTEALDDLQNRPAFDLYHEAHILRYQVSRYRWSDKSGQEASELRLAITSGFQQVTEKFSTLFAVAVNWTDPAAYTSRIVLNLRFIVPFFYAVQLDFYRAASPDPNGALTTPEAAQCISSILNIATIVHENESSNSLTRLAWALFVACVETRELVLQNWILERYAALSDFGVALSRAHTLLQAVVKHQRLTGEAVDYRSWVRSRSELEPFMIH